MDPKIIVGIVVALLVILAIMPRLNSACVAGPIDSAMALESAITKDATYAGTIYDNGAGYAPGGVGQPMAAVVDISAIDITSSDEHYTFQLTECATSDGTFTACGPSVELSHTLASAAGVISVPGFVSQRYLKLAVTISGTTPSITYSAYLTPVGR